jgi:drug/metabolite transporter (DMT)-like permease
MHAHADPASRRARHGLWLGAVGVLVFAFSIPMTRLAQGTDVAQLSPVFVALGRAAVAGGLSLAWLVLTRAPRPARGQWRDLAVTAAGVVFGWPLLLGFAVRHVEATHASVISGLLPLATAAVGAWILHQRPSRGFWAFAILGAVLVVAFAAWRGAGHPQWADALLLGAVLAASVGYVAGARLSVNEPVSVPGGADQEASVLRTAARASSERPGGAHRPGKPAPLTPEQVISWVLVISLPATLPAMVLQWPDHPVTAGAWLGFAYVSVFSMWLGFFAWYRGLAWGGTLRVSQIQLLQPFLSLLLSAPVLGERIEPATLAFSLAVMGCVFLGRRMPVDTRATAIPARAAIVPPRAGSADPSCRTSP